MTRKTGLKVLLLKTESGANKSWLTLKKTYYFRLAKLNSEASFWAYTASNIQKKKSENYWEQLSLFNEKSCCSYSLCKYDSNHLNTSFTRHIFIYPHHAKNGTILTFQTVSCKVANQRKKTEKRQSCFLNKFHITSFKNNLWLAFFKHNQQKLSGIIIINRDFPLENPKSKFYFWN